MKSKDSDTVKALRGIRASFITAIKEEGKDDIGDAEALRCLRKLEKMRKEAIEMFDKGGRQDLREAEEKELRIIQEYLPQLAGEDQTRLWVEEAIKQTGAEKMKDMGKVMGSIMKKYADQVDKGLVNRIAKEKLN